MMKFRFSRLKKLKNDEKGQSIVEFALISIPLLMLLLGIIEFGWLFNGQIAITGAAREGARAAVVGGDPYAAVERHVKATAVSVEDVTVTSGGCDTDRWQLVRVTGRIEPLVGLFVKNRVNLTAAATMRME